MTKRKRIRDIRTELGLTQRELAERLGVRSNTVTRWETGINPIPEWAEKAVYLQKVLAHSGLIPPS